MADARAPRLSVDQYEEGVVSGDRAVLARAITLVESDAPPDRPLARELLGRLLPRTGGAHRAGITGVPGAGKSTFIDSLGMLLVAQSKRVAVLAVDPSSALTGGSILGDKTRMGRLSREEAAFIRPSPSGGTLGGVARKTREAILVCEAAGFDVVLVETVGVGQSEAVVADMVDSFVLLMIAGAGDELQGIKRGILELVDVVAINKADGDNRERAMRARTDFASAMKLLRDRHAPWVPPVVACSALDGTGIAELWAKVEEHRRVLGESGELEKKRSEQQIRWMWRLVEEGLAEALRSHDAVRALLPDVERGVRDGSMLPTAAAEALLGAFRGD